MAESPGPTTLEEALDLVLAGLQSPESHLRLKNKTSGFLSKARSCFCAYDAVSVLRQLGVKSRAHGVSICQILLRENTISPFDAKEGAVFRDDKSLYYFFEKSVSLMQEHIISHFQRALDILVKQSQTRNTVASHQPSLAQAKLQSSSGLSRFISAASVVFGVDKDEDDSHAAMAEPADYLLDFPDIKLVRDPANKFPMVKSASLKRLVEHLTNGEYPDTHLRDSFLMTYQSFTTPMELLTLLRHRFSELARVPDTALKSVLQELKRDQLRVISVLKAWLEKFFRDFEDDPDLRQEMLDFARTDIAPKIPIAARQLEKALSRETELADTPVLGSKYLDPEHDDVGSVSFDSLSELDLASQLTLLESDLFHRIRPRELLGQCWSRKNKEIMAPNVLALISSFNKVGRWVTTSIVSVFNLEQRATRLQKCIRLAEALRRINNFNGVLEVISAINSSPVRRLKRTWELIDEEHLSLFSSLETLMSHSASYKEYRAAVRRTDPPCLPYLGVYLTDLTFLDDGNQDFVDDGLINFYKRELVAKVISEILRYQQVTYYKSFPEMSSVLAWLVRELENSSVDEQQAYTLSMKIEPRDTSEALEKLLMQEDQHRREVERLQVRIADLEAANEALRRQNHVLVKKLRSGKDVVHSSASSGSLEGSATTQPDAGEADGRVSSGKKSKTKSGNKSKSSGSKSGKSSSKSSGKSSSSSKNSSKSSSGSTAGQTVKTEELDRNQTDSEKAPESIDDLSSPVSSAEPTSSSPPGLVPPTPAVPPPSQLEIVLDQPTAPQRPPPVRQKLNPISSSTPSSSTESSHLSSSSLPDRDRRRTINVPSAPTRKAPSPAVMVTDSPTGPPRRTPPGLPGKLPERPVPQRPRAGGVSPRPHLHTRVGALPSPPGVPPNVDANSNSNATDNSTTAADGYSAPLPTPTDYDAPLPTPPPQ